MQVAVVGAGRWGANLIRTFQSLGALGAVVETHQGVRGKLEPGLPGVGWFSSLKELPKSITAVAVATPAPTHFAVACEVLASGRDVFVEKPMALSASDARQMGALAEAHGRVLMVGHLLVYQPAIRWISAFLKEGGLGQIYSLHQERLNLGRARAVENVLWSLGVHDVAVLLDLIGELPNKVQAIGQRALQPAVEDDFFLHLGFPSGIQAHLHVSWLWPERRRQLTLIGEKGMLVYDELTQSVVFHRKRIEVPSLENQEEGVEEVFRHSGAAPLTLELEHFLARCKDRGEPLSGAVQGLRVIETLEAARIS